MKKQKNYYKKFWIILFSIIGLGIITVYANGTLDRELTNSISTGVGANGSIQEFTPNGTESSNFATHYVNKENNSSIIGNYFKGYYYDSVYGFFKLNWDSLGSSKNVRIVNSTDKCDGYGYKLAGYAYNDNFGFVNFSYNNNTFVYYCVGDKKLHGYAYLENIGFQNFEGIGFEIAPDITTEAETIKSNNFVNDTTNITNKNKNNINNKSINGNIQYMKNSKGSVFYIIK